MGRNGMGKTTLMKSLMGILPAKSGSVSMDGADLTRAAELRARRQGPRLCAAGPHDLSDLTVKENIETGLVVSADSDST